MSRDACSMRATDALMNLRVRQISQAVAAVTRNNRKYRSFMLIITSEKRRPSGRRRKGSVVGHYTQRGSKEKPIDAKA
jgi:hypothetical protein